MRAFGFNKHRGCLSGASLGCAVVVLVTKRLQQVVMAGQRKFSKNQVVWSVSCYCGKASGVLKKREGFGPKPMTVGMR